MDVDEIAIEGRTNLILMDNNILAAGEYAIAQLKKIISRGYRVDFNQALDARLVDDRFAKLLANVKWIHGRIRFGCDTHGQIYDCERAMNLINSCGYTGEYFLYTMIGGVISVNRTNDYIIGGCVIGNAEKDTHKTFTRMRSRTDHLATRTMSYRNGRRTWRIGATRNNYFR